MKYEFDAFVCDFTGKDTFINPYIAAHDIFVNPHALSRAIVDASNIFDCDEYVKFIIPIEDIVQWNGKKVRVTIETVEEE